MSRAMSTFVLLKLDASMSEACARMTFPVYRHFLSLDRAPRHPEQGDDRVVQPVGFVARSESALVGLVLGELPGGPRSASDESDNTPEVLSLFVRRENRNQGIATALLERLERHIREQGFTLRFTPRGARNTPWYGRVRLSQEYQIFPWTELTPKERDRLRESQAESPWIPTGLEPWRHDHHSFDPVSSLGLRYRGRVVGWVINHHVPPATVRFTCSFVRKDLGRRGRILPLYTASLERLEAAGCNDCLFVTPVEFPTMVSFVRDRCAPWEGFLTETYGVSKRLTESQ